MKSAGAAIFAVCVFSLAACAIDTANAAIVPFNGTEYSWFHADDGGPYGGWITKIKDNISVRIGDSMQFQNRWYNGYAGTTDIRISYGGGFKYTCIGADEYVYLGLNYGNYYPSGTESVPFYATVTNCSDEPYGLSVNHQYVYEGIMYGSGPTGMRFHKAALTNETEDNTTMQDQQENLSATATPVASGQPASTGIPAAAGGPVSTPGFGFEAMILLTGAFAVACSYGRCFRK